MVREFRKADAATPLVLMGYYNPIYIHGVDKFLIDAKSAGVDGLIIVDLPPEEDSELCLPAMKAGLNFIRLATPTTDDKRLPAVLANTSGFVYYVSITGITGSASADAGDVGEAVGGPGHRANRRWRGGRHRAGRRLAGQPRSGRPRHGQNRRCGGRSCLVAGAGSPGRQTGRGISHNCSGNTRPRRLAREFAGRHILKARRALI
jgi:hypothetical protein